MRIGTLAGGPVFEVHFRPFLLGPIFKAQGWNTSPFNLYPAKGRHMWRDVERICAELSLPFRRPEPFPQSSLLAARVALVGLGAVSGRFCWRRVWSKDLEKSGAKIFAVPSIAPNSLTGCGIDRAAKRSARLLSEP